MPETLPVWVQHIESLLLGISLTTNLGLILRASQLTKINIRFERQRAEFVEILRRSIADVNTSIDYTDRSFEKLQLVLVRFFALKHPDMGDVDVSRPPRV